MRELHRAEPIEVTNLHEWVYRGYHQLRQRGDLGRRKPGLSDLPALLHPSLADAIFVVGAPRSGTSFLGHAIGGVPGISYHHEPVVTKNAVRYVHRDVWPTWAARLLFKTTYRWLLRATGEVGLRFAEKTPRNSLIVPFLAETFPDARFVHILRDGRDATASLLQKPWLEEDARAEAEAYPIPRGPFPRCWVEEDRLEEFRQTSDVHRCIWAWRSHVEPARSAGERLGPDRYREIRYEDLPTDPEGVAGDLAAFLDLDEAAEDALADELAEAHADSVGRWRDALDEDDLATIEAEAGALLAELGYD